VSGFSLYSFSGKRFKAIESNKESVTLILISWFILILAGALPYLISKTIPASIDILFETISGFTTTGTSILPDIEQLPKSILFWRSLTHWLGGIATIIMVITIMPALKIGGNKLFFPESLSEEKPAHSLVFIVARVFMVYIVLTVIQALFLYAGGMSLYTSLCYSFGTVSTGSFSPQNGNMAGYSAYIQYVMLLFMFLSGISYLIYYLIISGKYKAIRKNDEIRIYVLITFIAAISFTGILYFDTGKGFGPAFREGAFQVVSLVSSSGYSNAEYLSWPDFILPLMYLLIIIGGCVGSASGGIKMSRFLVLFRNFGLQLKNPTNSETNISTVKYNGNNIDKETNLSILTFIFVFGIVFVFGTLALTFFVPDVKESVFLSISALSNFGYNLSLSGFPNAGKIVLSLLMLIGRFEIFPVLLLFFPAFYKEVK
jgi:trk system potassium uptake protein TrkH